MGLVSGQIQRQMMLNAVLLLGTWRDDSIARISEQLQHQMMLNAAPLLGTW